MAESPRQHLHALVLEATGTEDDHLLADFHAWSAVREAAHEAALDACPDFEQDTA